LLWGMTAGATMAANLEVDKLRAEPRVRHEVVQAVEADCIRWVRQTQSWFNYCEPVPYYGKPPSHYEWGWNLEWGKTAPLGWGRAP